MHIAFIAGSIGAVAGMFFGVWITATGRIPQEAFDRGHRLGWVEEKCWSKGGELLPPGDPNGKCVVIVITPVEK
jgi:hypothetical protein